MKKLIFLFLVALGLRVGFALLFYFDGLYGQDPFAYFEYTATLRQALAAGEQPPPFFWPLGYPLLAALASFFTGLRPLAGQSISILAGSLLAPFVYLIVLEIEPTARKSGLIAGLLTATAAQLMLSSLSYMSDAAALAWATFSALALLRHIRTQSPRWLFPSAFALGWAVMTRWVYALAVLPWAVAAFLTWRQEKAAWSQRLGLAASAVLIGGIVLGAQFLLAAGQDETSYTGNLQVTTWNPANALKTTVTYADGTFTYERPVGLFYAMPILHPAFIFPLLTPFLLLGIWSLRKRPLPHTILLLGWPLVMYIFLIGTWENPRFSLTFFPPLTILTALGLHILWNASPNQLLSKLNQLPAVSFTAINQSTYLKLIKPLLILYLVVALLGSLGWAVRDLKNFTVVNNANIAAVRWVESQVPPDAAVITFGLTLTMQHRTGLEVSEIYHLDPASMQELVETSAPLFLFLDLENINSQWDGLSPQQNYLWLQENARLTEIGRHPPYTLFQLSPVP